MKHDQQKPPLPQPADELSLSDLEGVAAGADNTPSTGTSNVLKKSDDTSEGISANLKAS